MKKLYYLGALAGLILTSCANDDLVNPLDQTSVPNDGAIAFNMRLNNQTRDNVALNTVMDNFGVFAFKVKGDDDAAANAAMNALDPFPAGGTMSENVVMNNYKVEYDPSQKRYGSYWNYDGVNGQYLKYWDGSYRNTYFFAYGPHATTAPTFVKGTNPSIEFGTVEQTTDVADAFVYADVTKCANAEYVTPDGGYTTVNPKTVPLTFHRGMSQVRIAFHENIPGYSVEMASLKFVGETTPKNIVAGIPADKNGTDWERGDYAFKGNATVKYDDDFNATLEYTNLVFTDAPNLEFALPTGEIGNEYHANKTLSPTVYNVIPNTATGEGANSGLQFVMNYTLKSEDTAETIEVKGARVYVTPEYTKWAQNTVYTYVFLITRNSSGTTTGDDPDPDPEDPEDALYPIIFDQVVVTDLDNEEESEWIINGLQLSASEVNVAAGESATITCTFNNLAITDCTGIHVVWSTSNESVATVDNGVITGVGAGTATIICTAYENYVSDTEYSNMFTKTCTVNVTAPVTP